MSGEPSAEGASGVAQGTDLPPRLRFAKREIAKVLQALERANSSQVDAWMRVLDLEEQLADQREDTAQMRRERDALKSLLATGKATA